MFKNILFIKNVNFIGLLYKALKSIKQKGVEGVLSLKHVKSPCTFGFFRCIAQQLSWLIYHWPEDRSCIYILMTQILHAAWLSVGFLLSLWFLNQILLQLQFLRAFLLGFALLIQVEVHKKFLDLFYRT